MTAPDDCAPGRSPDDCAPGRSRDLLNEARRRETAHRDMLRNTRLERLATLDNSPEDRARLRALLAEDAKSGNTSAEDARRIIVALAEDAQRHGVPPDARPAPRPRLDARALLDEARRRETAYRDARTARETAHRDALYYSCPEGDGCALACGASSCPACGEGEDDAR